MRNLNIRPERERDETHAQISFSDFKNLVLLAIGQSKGRQLRRSGLSGGTGTPHTPANITRPISLPLSLRGKRIATMSGPAVLSSNKRKVHPFCGGARTDDDPEYSPSVSLRSAFLAMIRPRKSKSPETKCEKTPPWEEDDDHEQPSDLLEGEKEFFEDMRRVMRGEVINAARVEVRRKSSFRRVLGLVGRKMKASHLRGTSQNGISKTLPEKTRKAVRGAEEEGLCEKTVLLGRRSREKEVSHLGFFLEKTKTL